MRPDPIRSPDARPARGAQGPEGEGPAPVRGAEAAGRADRVEISTEGRLLAARLETDPAGEPLAPERAAEIRERIDSGIYDTPEVAAVVARRLLASGEV
jgi:hypothetical protein